MKKRNKKKKLNGIDIYLICSSILLILYTIVTQIIFVRTGGMEPSSLTISFFAAFGVTEGICCALIKNQKLKENPKNSREENLENTSENFVGQDEMESELYFEGRDS